MEKIPILRVRGFLLVTLQVDIQDRLAIELQDDVALAIVRHGAHGVLIDISSLDIVDSFLARMLATIASISKILGAETVIVGMRPAVAITLVELGLPLPGIKAALNVDRGMDLLEKSLREARGR